MINNEGRELGWDDIIEAESNDFVLLEAGDYDFEVTGFERARHNGSDKLPPCNKAIVEITVNSTKGKCVIKHNLFLHTITEGMLSSFFKAIGQKKAGETVKMDWNKVVGAKGRAKVGIRKWTSKNGEELSNNEIKKFYEAESIPQSTPQGNFEAGRF
jgi:hypothetical protein